AITYGVGKRPPFSFIPERFKARAPDPLPVYAPPPPHEFELTVRSTLLPDSPRITRRATLVRTLGKNFFRSSFHRLDGFLFLVPNVVVGRPQDCTVNVPGPLYTYTFVAAGTPYEKLAGTYIDSKTTPDRLPGIVGIENRAAGLTLASWMDTRAEVAYQTYLSGDGKRLTALFHTLRSDRMGDAGRIESDTQVIVLAPDFRSAQAEHRAELVRTLPLSTTTPDWVREMVILEMMPQLHGGFRGVAEKLPFYRDIGFNTLYLLPHWVGGYGNADPRQVDPALGTPDELKALVKRAHALGMRVLFDMVIHGFASGAAVAREHPEFFTRNEQGLVETHFNWGSLNTDPGNSAYVKFMEELVLNDLRTYDIDGYRVDANSFKSPNWDPDCPRRPWEASSTLPLYRAMYAAMQREKKDVVFYSEMFGPAWHSVSNLAQDANWAVVTDLFASFDKGTANAATYKSGMLQLQESLQPGVNRIRFCRNAISLR
ncbi:MAG: alpha-amylase family glycosyl hydrolase, partial [Planctomycetia bacterium]